jgi:hypothetical protein
MPPARSAVAKNYEFRAVVAAYVTRAKPHLDFGSLLSSWSFSSLRAVRVPNGLGDECPEPGTRNRVIHVNALTLSLCD